MDFEFDAKKSETNKKKHGIDFNEAKALWEDPEAILIPARTLNETRFVLIGRIKDQFWSAIFTLRETKIRIISIRKARENEKKIYQSRRI